MKQLVEYILTNITQNPEEVKVTETVDESGLHIIKMTVHPDDMGRVIGKSGKVIHAIRNLVRVAAIQKNLRVRVVLEEEGGKTVGPKEEEGEKTEAKEEESMPQNEIELTPPASETDQAASEK